MIRPFILGMFFVALLFACSDDDGSKNSPEAPVTTVPDPDAGQGDDPTGDDPVGTLDLRPSNSSCLAFERPQDNTSVKLQRAFSSVSLSQIVGLQQAPQSKRWYAIQRTGKITSFSKDDGSDQKVFLDMGPLINARPGEAGLLGMAWHPSRKDEFYLSYTIASSASPANLRSVIARFKSSDGLSAEAKPEVLLTLEQPFENHNGGHIAFGPDGYLYIAFGDGGSGGDPLNHGQNLNVFFGKILRIDVNSGNPYAIPQDNPFVGKANTKAEIFAYGLRNPWRFQFDRATGELWAGDVGQGKFEEIDRIQKGGNYGWKLKEGFECYAGSNCKDANVIDPVVTYGRSDGASVTGGFVYRGKSLTSLRGTYIYADFVSGNVWGLFPDASGKLAPKKLLTAGFNISSFAEDADGELFLLDYGSGKIQSLVASADTGPGPQAPGKLSQTGCFQADKPSEPTSGLIPYEVNSPLWSDAAAKRRWIALPDGSKIDVASNGHFEFPNGTVLVKEFALDRKIVETRLFIRHKDGVWAGYTYAWNEEGKDADLVLNGAVKKFGDQVWSYPSQAQCQQCHNQAAGFSLGLEIGQLNRTVGEASQAQSQLELWEKLGLFSQALPAEKSALPTPGPSIGAESAARAYLHANCSFCHLPGGTGGGNLDLRYSTSFKATGLCDAKPGSGDLGIADARLIAPGKPEKSVLLSRLSVRGAQQMPPLASNLVDTNAKSWVEAWIKGLTACP